MTQQNENILDRKIISLSEVDHLRFRQMNGTLVLGDPGSGKSANVGKHLFKAFVRAGTGVLSHAVKSTDAQEMKEWALEAGASKSDIVIFNEASGLRFDPLANEWTRSSGRGAGDVEGMVSFFSTLMSMNDPHGGGGGSEKFWERGAEQAMRHPTKLIQLGNQPLSIVNIHRAITSFPTCIGQQDEPGWEEQSFLAGLINAIRARKDTLTENEWQDLETSTKFIFETWATFDERPRSSIAMTFAGMADKFLLHPLRGIFASGVCDFTPYQITHEKKIVIVDFPYLEYGEDTARLINGMVLLAHQRDWLRHQYNPGCCNGALLYMDEFQKLMNRFQNHFVQVSRSSGIAVVALTQTILNLSEELGEAQPGAKTKAFLANLPNKITLRSTCPDSCTYVSDVIGKRYAYLDNFNSGSSGDSNHASFGGSRQLLYQVEPHEYSGLTRPDGQNPLAEAIVFCGGDHFNATRTESNPQGRNYLRVHFSR